MKHVALVLWLIFVAAPILAVGWSVWKFRELFGRCELTDTSGWNPYCWHYHHWGPLGWLTYHAPIEVVA